jgi:PAS domain S-box-containing protein
MSEFRRYGLALLSCCTALALSLAFGEPLVWFTLAVLASTLYGGIGPGIGALAASIGALAFLALMSHIPAFVAAGLSVVALVEAKRRAEARARKAEDLFNTRLTVDSIPGMVGTLTAQGQPEFHNARLLEYLGRTSEQMKDWPSIIHPIDSERVVQAWLHSTATAAPLDIEHRGLVADGSYRWFSNRGLPMLDKNGKILRWFHLVTDVDDRKRAEEALRISELNFRMIVETLPSLVLTMTAAGELEFVNRRRVTEFFGKGPEELKDWVSVVHPEDRPRIVSQWAHSIETGKELDVEVRLSRANNVYRWTNFRHVPLRSEDSQVLRWYCLITDIDERRRAEDALRASESDLALIIETIPGLVWCAAPDGSITYVNRRMLAHMGAAFEAVMDGGWADFLHPDDRDRVVKVWAHSVATGEPYSVQARFRKSSGDYPWFQSLSQLGRDEEGHPTRWFGLLVDVNDMKTVEDVLRNTQSKLARATQVATGSELSASIAHEMNQPLAAVVANGHACLRWLSAQPPNIAKALESADRIIRDAKGAGEVASRIRALFKRAAPAKVVLDLNDTVGEVVRLLQAEITKKRILMKLELAEDLPVVAADRIQLQQLLFNLLQNGIEAIDQAGDQADSASSHLTVRTRRDGPSAIVVEIADSGIGLENPAQIFDAFFTTKENGMGMGLAICRSIVEAHGGRLWAESNNGDGAAFFFTLPIEPSPQL